MGHKIEENTAITGAQTGFFISALHARSQQHPDLKEIRNTMQAIVTTISAQIQKNGFQITYGDIRQLV